MEESNDRAFKFLSASGVDRGGGECLPDDRLADVCCNEQRDSRSKTIALLQQLIEKDDNQTSNDQLNDQEEANTSTKVTWLAVEAGEDKDAGLAKGEDDGEQLLRSLVEFSVGLEIEVDIDEVSTGKELTRCWQEFSRRRSRVHIPGRPCRMR